MSADNRVCVMKWLGGWNVWHGSCSEHYARPSSNSDRYETEAEAFAAARKMEEEIGYVEGGTQRIGVEEQIGALTYDIADMSARLRRLITTGEQFDDPEAF